MGAGHSKSFRKRKKGEQYPDGMPVPQPYQHQNPFVPQNYQMPYPPPGYPAQQQGFVPQGYGIQQAPQTMLNWMPNDRERQKSRRSRRDRGRSEDYVGGFRGERGDDEDRHRRSRTKSRRASEPAPAPVIPRSQPAMTMPVPSVAPAQQHGHRAPTPFIPNYGGPSGDSEGSDEEDEEDDEPPPRRHSSRARRPSRRDSSRPPISFPQPDVGPNAAGSIHPLEPAQPGAYAPTGRRRHNPLPPPPRDLYEMSPYKQLLNLPQTTALLTTYNPQQYPSAPANLASALPAAPPPKPEGKKGGVKGLLRRLSTKKDKKRDPQQPAPQVRFIPVFVPTNGQPGAPGTSSNPAPRPPVAPPSASSTEPVPVVDVNGPREPQPVIPMSFPVPSVPGQAQSRRMSVATGPPPGGSVSFPEPSVQGPGGMSRPPSRAASYVSRHSRRPSFAPSHDGSDDDFLPVPPIPQSPPELRFDQESPYYVFMNHSPHRVLYRNQTYPTALHLHEAMKFLDHRPDIAAQIRATQDIHQVYPVSAQYHQFQAPDWSDRFMDAMEEVLYYKFKQHPDLRSMLLGTGTARLVYVDADDIFWGTGPDGLGQNKLGQCLGKVRGKLIQEAYGP